LAREAPSTIILRQLALIISLRRRKKRIKRKIIDSAYNLLGTKICPPLRNGITQRIAAMETLTFSLLLRVRARKKRKTEENEIL
jgi:hypothetical protein